VYLSVLDGTQNKQRIFPYKTLTDRFSQPRRSMFTARYRLDLYTECVYIVGGFCKTIFSQILNRNTWCYYHLKEECLQFHSDLKCIRCAPLLWHGRCPGDPPIPAKPSQARLVWRSRLRIWWALAILVLSLEVVGRKHCSWWNPTGRNHTLSGLKLWRNKILR